jgi:hypothetical protein
MVSSLSHGRVLFACAGSAVAALAIAIPALAASAAGTAPAAAAAPVQRTLSAAPLGVNVGTWDYIYYAASSVKVIQPLLKAAGIGQIRYGGGSVADAYDWQTNTDIVNCLPGDPTASFTSSCASKDTLGFAQLSRQARAISAQSLVTVNYGSGTPAMAAAWVRQAKNTAGQGVGLWEVGNENYGCWEVNNELAGAPEHYPGYVPQGGDNLTCPMATKGLPAGLQIMATSYAVDAEKFLTAMKAADPKAVLGVPWVFGSDGSPSPIAGGNEWNTTVLKAGGKYVSFVDAHWYPFGFSGATGGSNPTDQQVLRSLFQVPALTWQIRNELGRYDPGASFLLGEAGVSYNETLTTCTPAGALFAAGDVLAWLAGGASSVDWWDLNNYGNTGTGCASPDDGLFTSAPRPVPETPYWGYRLASLLARPHARLSTLATSDPADVLAYQAVLPTGKHVVALVNTNTAASKRVTFSAALSGTLQTWRYSAGNQNAANSKIVTGTAAASVMKGYTLPPESITILKTR